MSVTSGFFDSSGGDRKYNTEQMSSIFDGILKDGVYLSILNQFKVTPNVGMQITVDTGRAWFDHTWTLNDAKLNLTVEAAELIQNRIDAVVLEVNRSRAVRKNTIKMVKGTPASSPQNPTLTNTEFVKQYPLAYIRVNKGVTSIGTADITIMVGKDECPFATSFLEAVSVTELYEQWEADYSNWRDDQQQAFEEWFANVQGQLSDDPAGKLQAQINDIMAGTKTPATGMSVCTHVRSGTIHKLTGAGTGNNIRFVATSDFISGDTFQVNGTTCTVRTVSGDNLWEGFFKNGSVVTCYRNGNSLTFNSGGLPSSEVAKLTPENLKTGVSVNINGKSVTGTFTSDANAVESAIRSGFSAYVNGRKIVGNIPNKGAATITPTPYDQSISAGQYLTGNQTIKGDTNLAAQNIKDGISIFGVRGNYKPSDYFAITEAHFEGAWNKTIEVNAPSGICNVCAILGATYYYATVRIVLNGWNGWGWEQVWKAEDYVGTDDRWAKAEIRGLFSGYSRFQLVMYTDKDTRAVGIGSLQGF